MVCWPVGTLNVYIFSHHSRRTKAKSGIGTITTHLISTSSRHLQFDLFSLRIPKLKNTNLRERGNNVLLVEGVTIWKHKIQSVFLFLILFRLFVHVTQIINYWGFYISYRYWTPPALDWNKPHPLSQEDVSGFPVACLFHERNRSVETDGEY